MIIDVHTAQGLDTLRSREKRTHQHPLRSDEVSFMKSYQVELYVRACLHALLDPERSVHAIAWLALVMKSTHGLPVSKLLLLSALAFSRRAEMTERTALTVLTTGLFG